MAKLLKPVIAVEGKLRDSISLITVELSPLLASSAGNWDRDRHQCLQLLRSCVLPDKDTVLPPFENSNGGELFLVVASTDEHGAKILEKRIREQLEHSQELKTGCVFQVAATELDLPSQESGESIEQFVQKVADVITGIATLKLQRTSWRLPDGARQPHGANPTGRTPYHWRRGSGNRADRQSAPHLEANRRRRGRSLRLVKIYQAGLSRFSENYLRPVQQSPP